MSQFKDYIVLFLKGVSMGIADVIQGVFGGAVASLINFTIPVVIVFIIGCFLGLLEFSRFLSGNLAHYRFPTLALLTGFMIGSLNKLWPLRVAIVYRGNHKSEQVPAFNQSIKTHNNPLILQAILFAALGVGLVEAIEKTAALLKSKN